MLIFLTLRCSQTFGREIFLLCGRCSKAPIFSLKAQTTLNFLKKKFFFFGLENLFHFQGQFQTLATFQLKLVQKLWQFEVRSLSLAYSSNVVFFYVFLKTTFIKLVYTISQDLLNRFGSNLFHIFLNVLAIMHHRFFLLRISF